jgi:tetratricopeptide (TPR) repeat protein
MARGSLAEARYSLEQCIQIADEVSDVETTRVAYKDLGNLELEANDAERATAWYLLSREAARKLGDLRGEAQVTAALARVSQIQGAKLSALGYWEDAAQAYGACSDRRGRSEALAEMAALHHSVGENERAVGRYEESAAIAREIGDGLIELAALEGLVKSLTTLGQFDDIKAASGRLSALRARCGNAQREGS